MKPKTKGAVSIMGVWKGQNSTLGGQVRAGTGGG